MCDTNDVQRRGDCVTLGNWLNTNNCVVKASVGGYTDRHVGRVSTNSVNL